MGCPSDLGIGYRVGVVVVDRRTGTLGRVVDRDGGDLLLHPVGGGREWTCPPKHAALAQSQDTCCLGVPPSPMREEPTP